MSGAGIQPSVLPLRRLGSDTVHAVEIGLDAVRPVTVFGRPCNAVTGPVISKCGAMLRGDLIVMRVYSTLCPRCRRLTSLTELADLHPEKAST